MIGAFPICSRCPKCGLISVVLGGTRRLLGEVKMKWLCVCVSPQTSAVLCSGGCALLAVSSLLAIITIFLPSGGCERRICTLAGYMQMAAGRWRREHTYQDSSTHTNQ